MTDRHLFTLDGDAYVPSEFAFGRWGPDMLNGPALCAAAAHALERRHGDDDFLPARTTVDLFKAARGRPLTATTRVVREGRRIRVSEVEMHQDDVTVARATMVALRRSSAPPGDEWHSEHPFDPPAEPAHRWYGSDAVGWSTSIGEHQNASRKRLWTTTFPVIAGEHVTPYTAAVMCAEGSSMVTNWGDAGIGYINCDLTVALSRLPEGDRIGVEASSHITTDGVSVGTATLFDLRGPIGTGMVTAVSNAAAQIDFSQGVPRR